MRGLPTRWRSLGLPGAALLVVFVVAWVLIARQGMRNHVMQPDEALPLLGSRYLGEHFPHGLIGGGTSGRGLERALAFTFAFLQWLLASTPAVLKSVHIVTAGACASVALVTWAWARELGLRAWTAAGAGICAVAAPWSVFGATYLNAGPAQAATPLALYACWRAIVRPSPRRDAMALLALLLLGSVRVGNLTVAVAVPVAVLVVALHDRDPGVGLWRTVLGIPRRVWREHAVWVVAAVAGLLVVFASGGLHRAAGNYAIGAPVGDAVKAELRAGIGQLAAGLALLPVIIGGAWTVRSVLRPSGRKAAALATLLIASYAMFCYAAATVGPEERYISALAPLLILAFVVALERREVGVVLTAVSAVVVGREVVLHAFPIVGLPFGALSTPASTFFQRVMVGKASLWLPIGSGHPARSLTIVAGIGAVALVLLARRRVQLAVGAGLAVAALYGGTAGLYATHKYITGAAYPGLSFATQAWVDGKVGGDADVAILADPNIDSSFEGIFREVKLFNRSLGLRPYFNVADVSDPRTGAVTGGVPPYLVSVPMPRPIGLRSHQIASTTYLPQPLVLDQVEQPPRLAWAQQPSVQGGPIVVRFFAGPPGRCAVIGFAAPPGTTGSHRFSLAVGRDRSSGVLKDANPTSSTVSLPPGRTVDARLRVSGDARLVQVGLTGC